MATEKRPSEEGKHCTDACVKHGCNHFKVAGYALPAETRPAPEAPKPQMSKLLHEYGAEVGDAPVAPTHFVSACCGGEKCSVCGADATHKLGEEIPPDHPRQNRHNLTAYVCCTHFYMIVGSASGCQPAPVAEARDYEKEARELLLWIAGNCNFVEAADKAFLGESQRQLADVLRQRDQAVQERLAKAVDEGKRLGRKDALGVMAILADCPERGACWNAIHEEDADIAAVFHKVRKAAELDLQPLKSECDRDWKDESPQHIVNIAATGLYWRKKEIEAQMGKRAAAESALSAERAKRERLTEVAERCQRIASGEEELDDGCDEHDALVEIDKVLRAALLDGRSTHDQK